MTQRKPHPSREYLLECFDVDHTGQLTWRTRPASHFGDENLANAWNARWAGRAAGSWDASKVGHIVVIDGQKYRASAIVRIMTWGGEDE